MDKNSPNVHFKPGGSQLSSEDSKQFKKAKYAWQIKGTGKFKNSSSSCTVSSRESPEDISNNETEVTSLLENDISNDCTPSTIAELQVFKEQELPCLHSNDLESPFKQNKNKAEQSVSKNNSENLKMNQTTEEKHSFTSSGNTTVHRGLLNPPSLQSSATLLSSSFSPAQMVATCMEQFLSTLNRANYNLRKWQTKQIAKGIIDNAINKVLEEMGFIPLPTDVFGSQLMNSLPAEADGDICPMNIEDEGVSEAIRQQGLQRRSYPPQHHQHHQNREMWPSCVSQMTATIPDMHCEGSQGSIHPSARCSCWMHIQGIQSGDVKNSLQEASTEEYADDPYIEEIPEQQQDLLDAAVSFAISEKGLGVFQIQD